MDTASRPQPGEHDRGAHAHARPFPGKDTLVDALNRRLISAVFQPIVDLCTGELAAFESLTRPAPGSGFASVTDLFATAERTGSLWELEAETRRVVCEAAASWPASIQVTLNSTPAVFADPRFPESVTAVVQATRGLDPRRVVLEITERAETQHVDGLAQNVRALKAAGFQIAIDDVGAGSSGLNRIMALRPQWLKLDRELIDHIDQDPYRQNLIRFFVHFARLGGARLVAEGIERVEELGSLIDLGVVLGQGYLLGKPGSRDQTVPAEIAAWIRERAALRERIRSRDPRGRPISDIMREVAAIDGSTSAADAARATLADASLTGVAITSGRRFLGWVPRADIEGLARQSPGAPVEALVGFSATPVDHASPIAEVIASIVARSDSAFTQPVILTNQGEVVGMCPVRDVLRAAAAAGHVQPGSSGHTTPLTGLPDRSVCDQQVSRLIASRQPGDALFVDVRGLSSYNHTAGYDMGDLLIQHVAAVIDSVVRAEGADGQAWHLGDDRFMALAPFGRLSVLIEELLLQFERTRIRALNAAGDAAGPAPSLRVLVIPDAFQRVANPAELHRLAEQLRNAAHPAEPGSQVIVDRRVWAREMRRSA